jgi:hypothetical protein
MLEHAMKVDNKSVAKALAAEMTNQQAMSVSATVTRRVAPAVYDRGAWRHTMKLDNAKALAAEMTNQQAMSVSATVTRKVSPEQKDAAFEPTESWTDEILARTPGLLTPGMTAEAWIPAAVKAMPRLAGQKPSIYRKRLEILSRAAGQGPEGQGFTSRYIEDVIRKIGLRI